MSKLEPFGEGNPPPVFAVLGAEVTRVIPLSGGKHSKLEINYGGVRAEALLFGTPPARLNVRAGVKADLLVTLEVSEYGGRESISLKVSDHRPSGFNQNAYFSAKECYESYRRGEELNPAFLKKIIPSREELAAVFKAVKSAKAADIDRLYYSFDPRVMNYCKLRICIDICEELGIFDFKAGSGIITLKSFEGKADLESSKILNELRNRLK